MWWIEVLSHTHHSPHTAPQAIQAYDKEGGYVFSEKDENTWSSAKNQDYYGIAKTK